MKYDVVIAGSELSGLISAALLARKGVRVAVVSGSRETASHERDGYRFNKTPIPVTGLNDGPLGKIFGEIGLPKEGERGKVSYQVVLPDERVDIWREPEEFRDELRRCFPGEIDKVLTFYSHLSELHGLIGQVMDLNPFSFRLFLPSGVRKGRRSVKDLSEGLGLSRRFQAFIRVQIAAFSYLSGSTSSLAASSLLGSARNGIYHLEGGIDGIRSLILERVKALGVDLMGSPAKEASRNGNRWLLRTDEEGVSGMLVIGNMDLSGFCSLFLDGRKQRHIERIEKGLLPLTIDLGVKAAGIPVGMAENVIILRDYGKEPVYDNLLFVQSGPAINGKRSLSVTSRIPCDGHHREETVHETLEGMLEGIDRLCPFVDRHTEAFSVRSHEPDRGFLYTTSLRQRMGVGVLPFEMVRDAVFYAGPEVFPSLGFDGLVHSGEMAASAALRSLSRK
jgi:phytoene dehydrogenase-like protein